MNAIWDSWQRAGLLAWANLTRLVGLNLIWVLVSWPLVTLGPATLAAYWWASGAVRDGGEKAGYGLFLLGVRRFFWRGLAWALGWAVLLGLAYANFIVGPRLLPPFVALVAGLGWVTGLVLLAAAQPYLLEALVVEERSWPESLGRAGLELLANPLYSLGQLLVPAAALALGLRFSALPLLVLGSVILLFSSVAADGAPYRLSEAGRLERRPL